jgi:hypothetical protein
VKEFEFHPDSFYNKSFVERIPKFLLKQGTSNIKKIMNELNITPEVVRNIKIMNEN